MVYVTEKLFPGKLIVDPCPCNKLFISDKFNPEEVDSKIYHDTFWIALYPSLVKVPKVNSIVSQD